MDNNVLDLPEFLDRVQDDKELLVELLDLYCGDYEDKRAKLGEAVAQNNAEEARNLAHALKGSSGNISAKSLYRLFMECENNAKDGDLSKLNDLLSQVDAQWQLLSERIKSAKEELS